MSSELSPGLTVLGVLPDGSSFKFFYAPDRVAGAANVRDALARARAGKWSDPVSFVVVTVPEGAGTVTVSSDIDS
ncbi:hypothetical protein ACFRAQ_34875 [Nocardia sp. NPDC056611]|uniref:hypothetical protein n=1 Tax=Nocardia sp. NPDC056611 TaxID=3345877 RepID=UPI00366EB0B0